MKRKLQSRRSPAIVARGEQKESKCRDPKDGESDEKTREAAGIAYLDAVASTPDFDPNSPCGVAAKAYIAELS